MSEGRRPDGICRPGTSGTENDWCSPWDFNKSWIRPYHCWWVSGFFTAPDGVHETVRKIRHREKWRISDGLRIPWCWPGQHAQVLRASGWNRRNILLDRQLSFCTECCKLWKPCDRKKRKQGWQSNHYNTRGRWSCYFKTVLQKWDGIKIHRMED